MPLVSTEAIVLQAYPYSETSKILRLLTRTSGVRSVIAKGALRPRSRYGGVLEPFSVGWASFYVKEGRELQTLSGFELARSGQALGRDLVRFGAASLLGELVLRTATENAEPELFDQVHAALLRLQGAAASETELVALAETWALIGRLGFAPSFELCLHCARPLAPDEDAAFDYAAGGVRCGPCGSDRGGRSLPARARQALIRFARGEAAAVERTRAHWALLARFLSHHLAEGGAMRSLTFLLETVD